MDFCCTILKRYTTALFDIKCLNNNMYYLQKQHKSIYIEKKSLVSILIFRYFFPVNIKLHEQYMHTRCAYPLY